MRNIHTFVCLFLMMLPTAMAGQDLSTNTLGEEEYVIVPSKFDSSFIEALRQKHAGNIAESIELLKKCYELNPQSAIVSFELGNLYLQQKEPAVGLSYIQNAVRFDPSNYFYQDKLAVVLKAYNRIPESIEVLERMLLLLPDKDNVLYELAQLYARIGENEKSIEKFNLLEKRIGLNRAISYGKSEQYILLGKPKKAHKELDAMLQKTPTDISLWIAKGNIELDRGKLKKAAAFYQKASDINAESGYVHLSWARYYELIGDNEKSEQYICKLFGAADLPFQDKLDYLELIASYYGRRTDAVEKMHAVFISLLEANSTEYLAHKLYAQFLIDQQNFPVAMEHLYSAALLQPDCFECWATLVELHHTNGNVDEAYRIVLEGLDAMPNQPALTYYAAVFAMSKGEKDISLQYVLQLIEHTEPEDATFGELNRLAYAMLVDVYLRNKEDYPKALDACQDAIRLNTGNYMVLNNCAYTMGLTNTTLEEAERLSAKTLEGDPLNTTYLDTYAYILLKQKRYDEALFFIEKAVEYSKNDQERSVIFEHYGDILYFSQQPEKAVEMWEKAANKSDEITLILQQKINTKKYVE